jgi:2'-hydroxyisoflavone reductase
MRLLILGGTVFLGRALTDAALAGGHDVTHLNRGRSSPPDPRVETLTGDRTGDLGVLGGHVWDAVVDTSGYLPQVVKRSVDALQGAAERYLFVSSISAYEGRGYDEDAPVAPPLDPVPEAMTMETYGGLKAMCESVVRAGFGDKATIVRPGLIVGPHDPTDRFTYWPVRIARGGRVAAPGRRQRTVQFIDVRDLASWMIRLLENRKSGTFNAAGPARRITMEEFLDACRAVSRSGATLEWIDDAFLATHDIAPWKELPLWVPEDEDDVASGFLDVPLRRALLNGLQIRKVRETIADTIAWNETRAANREWKAGLAADREEALLKAWDAARAPGTPGQSR